MARRIALLAALAPLVLPAVAGAATPSRFFAGTPVDGPSADIQSLGRPRRRARRHRRAGLRQARWRGRPRLRLAAGRTGPSSRPSRSTPGWPAPAPSRSSRRRTAGGSSWPTSAAAGSSRPCARPERPATPRPSRSPHRARTPSVDMSINGVGLPRPGPRQRRRPGCPDGARRDGLQRRAAVRWTSIPPRWPAPAPGGRRWPSPPTASPPSCGARAATPTRAGSSSLRLSTAPQDLGAGRRRAPTSPVEDDSSFAWAVFRQGGQTASRGGSSARSSTTRSRCRPSRAPRRRGWPSTAAGSATRGVAGTTSAGAYGAVLKDDLFNPSVLLGGGFGARRRPCRRWPRPATALIAFQQGDASGGRAVIARPTTTCPRREPSPSPGPDRSLEPGARTDRRVARARGRGRPRRRHRRSPSSRATATGARSWPPASTVRRAPSGPTRRSKWRKFARPPLKWGTAFELWGPLTYTVLIDDKPSPRPPRPA